MMYKPQISLGFSGKIDGMLQTDFESGEKT